MVWAVKTVKALYGALCRSAGQASKRIGMEIQRAIKMVFLWKVGITGCAQYHHDQSFTPTFETGNPE